MSKTDWHIHTTASDGIYSPTEVVKAACYAGISQMAISDHDTLAGWQEIVKSEELQPMYLIPAIEFGADISSEEDEVHILGYGVDPSSDELFSYMERLQEDRRSRFRLLLDKSAQAGFQIPEEELVLLLRPDALPGRLHLARLLVQGGYFASSNEAFENFLGVGRPGYVPRFRYGLEETCDLIRRTGGITVLAHPYEIEAEDLRKSLLFSDLIDGIEAFHPSHGKKESEFLLGICQSHRKYATGGSDYHGVQGRYPEKLGEFFPPTEKIGDFIKWASHSPYGIQK